MSGKAIFIKYYGLADMIVPNIEISWYLINEELIFFS